MFVRVYFALRSPYLNLKNSLKPSKEDLDNGLKFASIFVPVLKKIKNGWGNLLLFVIFVKIKLFFYNKQGRSKNCT